MKFQGIQIVHTVQNKKKEHESNWSLRGPITKGELTAIQKCQDIRKKGGNADWLRYETSNKKIQYLVFDRFDAPVPSAIFNAEKAIDALEKELLKTLYLNDRNNVPNSNVPLIQPNKNFSYEEVPLIRELKRVRASLRDKVGRLADKLASQ